MWVVWVAGVAGVGGAAVGGWYTDARGGGTFEGIMAK
jgi:hypothetical protein